MTELTHERVRFLTCAQPFKTAQIGCGLAQKCARLRGKLRLGKSVCA